MCACTGIVVWLCVVLLVLLDVAVERECEGDLILRDMGAGMPFRAGMFDGVIRYEAVDHLLSLLQ